MLERIGRILKAASFHCIFRVLFPQPGKLSLASTSEQPLKCHLIWGASPGPHPIQAKTAARFHSDRTSLPVVSLQCFSLIRCFVTVDFVCLPFWALLGMLSVVTSQSSTGPARMGTKQMPAERLKRWKNQRKGKTKASLKGVPNSWDY